MRNGLISGLACLVFTGSMAFADGANPSSTRSGGKPAYLDRFNSFRSDPSNRLTWLPPAFEDPNENFLKSDVEFGDGDKTLAKQVATQVVLPNSTIESFVAVASGLSRRKAETFTTFQTKSIKGPDFDLLKIVLAEALDLIEYKTPAKIEAAFVAGKSFKLKPSIERFEYWHKKFQFGAPTIQVIIGDTPPVGKSELVRTYTEMSGRPGYHVGMREVTTRLPTIISEIAKRSQSSVIYFDDVQKYSKEEQNYLRVFLENPYFFGNASIILSYAASNDDYSGILEMHQDVISLADSIHYVRRPISPQYYSLLAEKLIARFHPAIPTEIGELMGQTLGQAFFNLEQFSGRSFQRQLHLVLATRYSEQEIQSFTPISQCYEFLSSTEDRPAAVIQSVKNIAAASASIHAISKAAKK